MCHQYSCTCVRSIRPVDLQLVIIQRMLKVERLVPDPEEHAD
jgi:hypothetical protein